MSAMYSRVHNVYPSFQWDCRVQNFVYAIAVGTVELYEGVSTISVDSRVHNVSPPSLFVESRIVFSYYISRRSEFSMASAISAGQQIKNLVSAILAVQQSPQCLFAISMRQQNNERRTRHFNVGHRVQNAGSSAIYQEFSRVVAAS